MPAHGTAQPHHSAEDASNGAALPKVVACCLVYAACCTLPVVCCMLYAACCTLPVARCMLHACCMVYHDVYCKVDGVRRMLYVARCTLHVAWCRSHVARCMQTHRRSASGSAESRRIGEQVQACRWRVTGASQRRDVAQHSTRGWRVRSCCWSRWTRCSAYRRARS